MIRFSCPICSSILESPEKKAGLKIHCPKCRQKLQVPIPQQAKTRLGKLVEPSQPSAPTRAATNPAGPRPQRQQAPTNGASKRWSAKTLLLAGIVLFACSFAGVAAAIGVSWYVIGQGKPSQVVDAEIAQGGTAKAAPTKPQNPASGAAKVNKGDDNTLTAPDAKKAVKTPAAKTEDPQGPQTPQAKKQATPTPDVNKPVKPPVADSDNVARTACTPCLGRSGRPGKSTAQFGDARSRGTARLG